MSLFHIFSDSHLNQLIDVNNNGKHKVKNEYLINQLAYLPLSLIEHNQLKVWDLINSNGQVCSKIVVPLEYSKHDEERVIELPEKFCISVENYLNWYSEQKIPTEYKQDLNSYRGFSSEAPMLLNDQFNAYALSTTKTSTGVRTQASNLRNKVRKLLDNAGFEWATFSTFSDSLIVYIHQNGCEINQIVKMFNFRSRETVLSRISGNIVTLGDALNKVYSRVNTVGYKNG
jgi:hypothetical protein